MCEVSVCPFFLGFFSLGLGGGRGLVVLHMMVVFPSLICRLEASSTCVNLTPDSSNNVGEFTAKDISGNGTPTTETSGSHKSAIQSYSNQVCFYLLIYSLSIKCL